MTKKWVYLARNGKSEYTKVLGHDPELLEMKEIFGGKGAGLMAMTAAGAPVPPAFTITTEACIEYMETNELPEGMWDQTLEALEDIEEQTGKTFGEGKNPLLVSVRSGARVSMPGMMDTVLNLGLNDETRASLAKLTDNEWFSYDAHRRFISMFSDIVMGYSRLHFEEKLEELKEKEGVELDTEVSLEGLKWLVEEYKKMYKARFGEEFPTDPYKQLELSIKAVFDSWNGERAVAYRDHEGIPHNWGTAVNVQTMVFGNMGEDSATGVAFSRDPATGAHEYLYGEFLPNAQGEDVVAGIRTPHRISLQGSREWAKERGISEEERANRFPSLEEMMPEVYQEFLEIVDMLENYYKDMQDMEFTIERGKLWMLQTRTGKRTGASHVKIAVDLCEEGVIEKETALERVKPMHVELLLRPSFDPKAEKDLIAKGLNASPGAAVGIAVFDAERAKEAAEEGKDVILVRPETVPDEVPGMLASKGVLTQKGGATSHAAVVARGSNLPAVVGCEQISVDVNRAQFTVGDKVVKEGDVISIDGFNGEVYAGKVPLIKAEYEEQEELITLLEWADEVRVLGVRANADDGEGASESVMMGAEGIGLARTEHMFFDEAAREAVVNMIIAKTDEEREAALADILPVQEKDFEELFAAMDGKPVIMRLIDPPMHEFLPSREELIEEVTRLRIEAPKSDELAEKEKMLELVNGMWEVNPMMGLRGCRAGIMYKGLTETQTRAYVQAACRCKKRGVDVHPEIMIPLVGHVNELKIERKKLEEVAAEVMEEEGVEVPLMFGTMIEIPRAALTAAKIAQEAEFFSFGTNDLTQMTYGYSRDDAEGKFLMQYVDEGILPENPFQVLDQEGVGRLVKICVEEGKAANPDLEIGICGEHGGEPKSIDFCHRVGLDYVSCSPYRVPVARLAAAHAAIRNRE
ncbi:MAG: pyruvate, phosphate dikinase [Chloroflexi bacterium]|jgi:pyruvate,orthophosphate dikinase|nr:pyruvate, phosphate dikinase [Chloroflexota bacterium]